MLSKVCSEQRRSKHWVSRLRVPCWASPAHASCSAAAMEEEMKLGRISSSSVFRQIFFNSEQLKKWPWISARSLQRLTGFEAWDLHFCCFKQRSCGGKTGQAGRWECYFFLSLHFPLFYFCLSNKAVLTHLDSPKKSGNAISEKPEICGLEKALSYGSSVQHRKE